MQVNKYCLTELVLSCPAERDCNACQEGSVTPLARVNMADDIRKKVYKSKSSSHSPHFDASNAWQMGLTTGFYSSLVK